MSEHSIDRRGPVACRIFRRIAAPALGLCVCCGKAGDGVSGNSASSESSGSPASSSGAGAAVTPPMRPVDGEGFAASQIADLTWTAPPGAAPIDLRVGLQAGGGVPSVNASGEILLASRGYTDEDGAGNTLPVLTRRSSGGDALWSNAYAADAFLFPVLLPQGSTLVAGDFRGRLDLGDAVIESARNPEAVTGSGFYTQDPYARGGLSRDIAVFRTSVEGRLEWSRRFGGAGDQRVRSAAPSPAGELVVAGPFFGALVMDEHRVTSTNGASSPDVFVARIDGAGSAVSLARLDLAQVDAVCVDDRSSVWVAGRVARGLGEAELGGHELVKLDSEGEIALSLHATEDTLTYVTSMACGPEGSVYVLYAATSRASLFGSERRSEGALVALSGDGTIRWIARLDGNFTSGFVASAPGGNVGITGTASPVIDLGAGPLAPGRPEELDMFFASYTPDGALRYAFRIGGAALDGGAGVAAIASSRWLVSFYLGAPAALEGQTVGAGEHLLWIDER